jgi:hypothetical protein
MRVLLHDSSEFFDRPFASNVFPVEQFATSEAMAMVAFRFCSKMIRGDTRSAAQSTLIFM